MPLIIAPQNVDLKIKKILVDERLKKHFESLGIIIGSIIRIIDNVCGNLVVIVKNVRLAIDKSVASKILV